jgi:hypothetical protein
MIVAEVLRGPAPVVLGSPGELVAGLACPVQRARHTMSRSLVTFSRSTDRRDHLDGRSSVATSCRCHDLTNRSSLIAKTVTRGGAA